jgi:hypothetical protein
VFTAKVNTTDYHKPISINGLKSIDRRCLGVYPVLAIELNGWLHQKDDTTSHTKKNPGYSIFRI